MTDVKNRRIVREIVVLFFKAAGNAQSPRFNFVCRCIEKHKGLSQCVKCFNETGTNFILKMTYTRLRVKVRKIFIFQTIATIFYIVSPYFVSFLFFFSLSSRYLCFQGTYRPVYPARYERKTYELTLPYTVPLCLSLSLSANCLSSLKYVYKVPKRKGFEEKRG